jgi:AcrR family transcriptional regulator
MVVFKLQGPNQLANPVVGCSREDAIAVPSTRTPIKAAREPGKRRAYLPAAERRKSIIAAAQTVFARSNLQGARTRDIAKAAEVNQATIFEHFASKEALFQAAVVQPLIDAMQGMHERMEVYQTAGTPDEIAALALPSAQRHLRDMVNIFPLFTAAMFSDPDLGRQLYHDHIAPILRQRGQVLDGITRDGLDRDFVGLANFGMLFAVAMDRHFGGGDADLDALAEQFTRMATGGFAGDKRRQPV